MNTAHERLALLRGLLHAAPSLWGWTQLCALLEGWPEDGTREVALEYARHALDAGWEDALRPPPQSWRAAWLAGAPPLGWPLVRAFDVVLEDAGSRRIPIIRLLRSVESSTLSAARDLAVLTPSRVLQAASLSRAEELVLALEAEGASARCAPSASAPAPPLAPRPPDALAPPAPPEAPADPDDAWGDTLRATGGLVQAMTDPDPRVRARALNELQPDDAPSLGVWPLPALDDPVPAVAHNALRALIRLGRPEHLSALLAWLEALEEPDARETFLALTSWGLRSLPPEHLSPAFLASLQRLAAPLLEAPEAGIRAAAVGLLQLAQPPGEPLRVERVRALLRDDPNGDVQLAALNLLAFADYPERVQDMAWALDAGLAPHAPLQALGASGDPAALPPLVRYLERAAPHDVDGALAAILRLRLPACQRWAVLALKHVAPALRLEGASLLREHPAPEAREPLLRATFDINAEVARVAREALNAL